MSKQFTGWHMTAILVCFFGVVMAVNFIMAGLATSTFGGVVVPNSYVASQEFNRWLDQAEAQQELGWDAVTAWRPDGRLVVTLTGAPMGVTVSAVARHPLGRMPDRPLTFQRIRDHVYLSDAALPEGRWTMRMTINYGEQQWRREDKLQ